MARFGGKKASEPKHVFSIFKIKAEEVQSCESELNRRGYQDVPLKSEYQDFKVLVHKSPTSKPPRWQKLLEEAAEDPGLIKSLVSVIPSFAVLVRTPNGNWYASGGGLTAHLLHRYCDPEFGIEIAARILPPHRLKNIRSKSLAGRIVQEDVVYRGYYNYSLDPGNLGKVTKELIGELSRQDVSELLGLGSGVRNVMRLHASSSHFTVQRSLNLKELKVLAESFDTVLSKKSQFDLFKGYREVESQKEVGPLKEKLISDLTEQYQRFLENPDEFVEDNIGLSYDDPKRILLCTNFTVSLLDSRREVEHLDLWHVFDALRQMGKKNFRKGYIGSIHIEGFDPDGKPMIERETVYSLLYAEVKDSSGRLYSLVDSKWYSISGDFRDQVNQKVKAILDASGGVHQQFVLPPWPVTSTSTVTEPEYIDEICHQKEFVKLHGDHVVLQGGDKSEICDVLDTRALQPRLVFLKKGFGSYLREALAQVRTSAELLDREPKFTKLALAKIQECTKKEPIFKTFTECHLVLAVTDHSIKRAGIQLLDKLTTVVKLDLVETHRFVTSDLSYKMYLHEIPHCATVRSG
jgi:uncharacterized protein (TIGR04141 family)